MTALSGTGKLMHIQRRIFVMEDLLPHIEFKRVIIYTFDHITISCFYN